MALGIKSTGDIEVGDILYAKGHTVAYIAPDIASKAFSFTNQDIGEVLDTNVDGIDTEDYNNYIEVAIGGDTLYVVYDVQVLEFKANPEHNYPAKETSTATTFDVKKGIDTLLKLLGVNKQSTTDSGGKPEDNIMNNPPTQDSGNGNNDSGNGGLSITTIVLLVVGVLLLIGLIVWLLRPAKQTAIVATTPIPQIPTVSLQGTNIPKPLKMT